MMQEQSNQNKNSFINKSIKVNTSTGGVVSSGESRDIIVQSINTVTTEKQKTLTEAAAEIQKLLQQLQKTNPTATEQEMIEYVNDETTPSFKRCVVGAVKAGGEVAIEEFLANPYINVGKAIVKGWLNAK